MKRSSAELKVFFSTVSPPFFGSVAVVALASLRQFFFV